MSSLLFKQGVIVDVIGFFKQPIAVRVHFADHTVFLVFTVFDFRDHTVLFRFGFLKLGKRFKDLGLRFRHALNFFPQFGDLSSPLFDGDADSFFLTGFGIVRSYRFRLVMVRSGNYLSGLFALRGFSFIFGFRLFLLAFRFFLFCGVRSFAIVFFFGLFVLFGFDLSFLRLGVFGLSFGFFRFRFRFGFRGLRRGGFCRFLHFILIVHVTHLLRLPCAFNFSNKHFRDRFRAGWERYNAHAFKIVLFVPVDFDRSVFLFGICAAADFKGKLL